MKLQNENTKNAIYSSCKTCYWFINGGCSQDNRSKEECLDMGDYKSLAEQAEINERSKKIRYNHKTSQQYTV